MQGMKVNILFNIDNITLARFVFVNYQKRKKSVRPIVTWGQWLIVARLTGSVTPAVTGYVGYEVVYCSLILKLLMEILE